MADPKIKYDIEANVSGEASVDVLEKSLRGLGDTLEGDLKAKALDSANALEKINAKTKALDGYKTLGNEAKKLGVEMGTAAQKVDELGNQLPQASAATKALADAQAQARTAVEAAKTVLAEQRAALAALNTEYTGSARKTTDYKEASGQLKTTIADLRDGLTQQRQALTTANAAAKDGAAAEKALTTEYAAAVSAARNVSAELGSKNRALESSRAALKAVGIETTGLNATEMALKASLAEVRKQVETLAPEFAKATTAGAVSAKSIKDAYSTLGVQTFAQVQTEVNKVRAALELVKTTSKNPLEIKIATEAAQQKIAELEGGVKKVGTASEGVSGILRSLGPLMATAFSGRAFIETITDAESLNRSFEQIFGSTQKARLEMDFIKSTANKLGLETLDLARSYQSLAASTKGTNLEGQATREIFESVSRAMSSLGKSSVETDRALAAVSQMASKGTVAMEELRGQLGEALPGALKAAADGAGITTAQLIKMVESGTVLAEDLLPALTKGLNGLYGNAAPPDSVISNWARFKNVITETAVEIGEGGASKGLATALSGATLTVRGLHVEADVAGTVLGKMAAEVSANGFNLKNLQGILREGQQDWEKHKEVLLKAGNAAGLLTEAERATVKGMEEAKGGTQQYTDAIDRRIASETKAAAVTLGTKSAYTEARTEQEKLIEVLGKKQAAWDAESATLTRLVAVYGTEREKREAATIAATQQATASHAVADAKQVEVAIVESYLLKLEAERLSSGKLSEAKQKELDQIRILVESKKAEAQQATQLARSKQIEADASKASAQATQDNSARVYEYRGAMGQASLELERLIALQKQGKATDEDVAAARSRLAAATLLYRDALHDASEAATLHIAIERQSAQLKDATISVDLERVRALREVADASGDAAKSTQLQTQATQLEVTAAREHATGLRTEAQAIRDAADAKEAELKATGELTTAHKAEIAAQRQSAELKDLDAKRSDILAEKTRMLAQSLDQGTSALERQNAAQERANAATEKAIELENKRKGVDKDGFATDKSGQRLVAGSDLTTRTGIKAFLKSAGVTDDAAANSITNEFANAKGEIDYFGNAGQRKYGGEGSSISQALLKAAEAFTFGDKQTSTAKATSTTTTDSTVKNVYTVNYVADGKTTAINTADEASAKLLAALLQSKLAAGL